jgi:hypothetical protein
MKKTEYKIFLIVIALLLIFAGALMTAAYKLNKYYPNKYYYKRLR